MLELDLEDFHAWLETAREMAEEVQRKPRRDLYDEFNDPVQDQDSGADGRGFHDEQPEPTR